MFDLRQRIFIIVGVVAGLIVAVILFDRFVLNKSAEPASDTPGTAQAGQTSNTAGQTSPQSGGGNQVAPSAPTPAPAPTVSAPEIAVRQLARMFVERFGSYSNQSTDSRVADLLAFSTAQVEQWLKTQEVQASGAYQGYTTKVVAMQVTAIDASKATVHVDTQQVSETSAGSTTSYRSGRVELVKAGAEWKVNGFYWDKK